VYHRIIAFLEDEHVAYECMEHEHVHSSQDAAKVRGTKLEEAAKALVLQVGSGKFIMCVVAGHRKLDLKVIKQLLEEKNVSLAHPDVVLRETGCPIGTVPPFGNLFNLPLYVDAELLTREHIVFSAASHNHSVRMKSDDWLRITGAQEKNIGA
jgi:Ala-tRNA(Pro) deacylase